MLVKWISIGLGLLLIVCSSAVLALHTWFPGDVELEQALCRFYLCGSEQLLDWAHRQLWLGDAQSVKLAVQAYEESLRRDPASPFRWCDLGEALVQMDDLDRASSCYHRAVELGPNSPPILLRAAYFYNGVDKEKKALELMGRILSLIREYDQVIFSHHTRMGTSAADVLRYGMPEDGEAAQSYFRYLLGKGKPADLARAWDWMSARSLTNDFSLSRYVDFLLRLRQYDGAARTLTDYVGGRDEGGQGVANLVFNPSFENEPLGTALDWTIRGAEHVETARDSNHAWTGSWSLRIRFGGQENVAYRHLAQKLVATPGRYRFQARVRTEEITTDQGVGFRIFAADRSSGLDVRTEPLLGTSDWKTVEATFSVPPQTKLLEIQAVRRRSHKIDSKIAGTVWIDDVSLVRQ